LLDTYKIRMLTKSLDVAALRQRVISDNIANVDTPHYKAKSVTFEEEFKRSLESQSKFEGYRTDPRHLPIGGKRITEAGPKVVVQAGTMQNNENNVDIDAEMTKMTENQIWYNLLVDQTNSHYQTLRKVITGGKG